MFAYLEGVIVLKLSPIIGVGDSFEHVGALRIIDNEGMWVKELDKYETSVLTMMQMKDCRPSTSPKLEKQTEPGDDDPCEHPELYKSAVCTILYMTKRRPDLQATTRWMCKRLRNPQPKVMETIGQNCEVHQGVERFGDVHAESRQVGCH